MSWIGRILGGDGPPPWSPFDRADHVRFVTAVRAALLDRSIKLDRAGLASGELALPADAVRPRWDLRPLAARCAQIADTEQWHALAAEDLGKHLREAPARARGKREPSRIIPPERMRRQTTELDTTHLRTQVWSRTNPVIAAMALDGMIHRAVGPSLVEVAVWDLDGAGEQTVPLDDPGVGGLDVDEVLTRGRVQAVAAEVDGVVFRPVEVAGASAEIAASNGYYVGACMLQLLDRVAAPAVTIVCPVSTHHWILVPATAKTTLAVLDAVRDLAETILDQSELGATEHLGDELLWWPGGGEPEVIVVDGDDAIRLSPDQLAHLRK